jgi:hypothetical protein
MSEIKVNAYGIINFTKRQYLITQAIVFALLMAVVMVSYVNDYPSSDDILLKYLTLGSLIIMALEIIETLFMLKKFKDKARAQAEAE